LEKIYIAEQLVEDGALAQPLDSLDSPVTIAPQEDTSQPVTVLADDIPTVSPSFQTTKTRSQKAYVGLGEATGQSEQDMYSQIKSGQEQNLRESAAAHLNAQAAMKTEQKLIDERNKAGRPLSMQEANRIINPFDAESERAYSNDVIEKAYGMKFISMANTAASYMKNTFIDEAAQEIPEHVVLAQSQMGSVATKTEIARTKYQDISDEIESQGYIPWAWDVTKTMFQPYNELKMRGLNPEAGGWLLGNSLKAQADELVHRPLAEYTAGLNSITDRLRKDNPQLARQFVEYVLGRSNSDVFLDNTFTVLTPLDYIGGVKLTKNLIKKVELYNRVNTGFKQTLKEAAKTEGTDAPVKAVVQEALGDVHGAATTRAVDHFEQSVTGTLNPIQDIKESLTSNFRLDGDALDANPGNLSATQLTKLKDSFYDSGMKLYNTLVDILRVNRTLAPLQEESALRAYQAAARKSFPQDEGILDIGSPFHVKETNNYYIPFTFGNSEGRLFSDAETASNYARSRGYAEPRIVPTMGTVEKEPRKLVGSATDLKTRARLEKSIPVTEEFLARIKDQASRKFIGPRQPEVLQNLQDTIKSTKGILEQMKKTQTDVNARIVTSDPVVEQHGLGYKFTVWRPYNETDPAVRSYLLSTEEARSPDLKSWKNSVLGYIRGADDTLAYNDSMNRKVATYTQTAVKQWAKAEADKIEEIANRTKWYTPWTWGRKFTQRQMFDEFNGVLDYSRTAKDPKTGNTGYFFKTPGELDDHYSRYYGRLPSLAETEAYFANVKLVEGNRVLSEIEEFRNRARLGAEQHQIFLQTGQGSAKTASGWFDGIQRPEIPRSDDLIMFMGTHRGQEDVRQGSRVPPNTRTRYTEAVRTGKARVLEVYSVSSNPLEGFVNNGKNIRYIVTTDSESKPLALNHVNRRGGGHFEYDYDHFVKQADITTESPGDPNSRKIYNGDRTFMAVSNRAMGDKFAENMNRMNEFWRNKDIDGAKAHAQKLGIDWDQVEHWYGGDNPWIDMHEPFRTVKRNHRLLDIDKSLEDRVGKKYFVDAAKSGSLDKQFQVAYTQARDAIDLMEVRDIGTQGNPVYKISQANKVDPIPTMSRALNRAVRSTFMNDYKIQAVEHWLQEARPYLKADESQIRSAPFYYFHNADEEGAFKSDTPLEVRSNLLSNRYKINQFVGTPNAIDASIHSLTQKLADSFYEKLGPEENRSLVGKARTIVPLWALSRWKDPISGIRSFAFNAKLGVFSIPQFFVQSQTFANIWAIGGRDAAHGTFATMLHQWSRINKSDKFMQAYDDFYTRLPGFGRSKPKPGEFMEANTELAKTGFEHVAGEYQLADDQLQHNFFKGTFGNFLDAGQVFFREGEKATRLGAWYTSFREFRHDNPLKVLTDADRMQILQKADLYTANMSRASASALNSSIFSLPMQFLTYQVRMSEMFFGKRLGETLSERNLARARLLGVYSTLYGIPGALGITGWPWGDTFREAALNKGYVPGNSQWQDMLMNGLISWNMAMISGKGDYESGQQYDVQGRWGTQGFTAVRESLRSDNNVWKLIAGAGPSVVWNTATNVIDPFWQMAKQITTDDEEGNVFKLTPSHFAAMFNEVSSIDSTTRAIYALHSGRWLSKNEKFIEGVTPGDVLTRWITGIQSQDQTDIYSMHNISQSEKEVQARAEKEIVKDYQRGLDAARDKDYDTAKQYFSNARARTIISGMPVDKRAQIYSRAMNGYESQSMTTLWDWAERHAPAGEERTRIEAATRRQELMNKRAP
jgi:hypothetical protein